MQRFSTWKALLPWFWLNSVERISEWWGGLFFWWPPSLRQRKKKGWDRVFALSPITELTDWMMGSATFWLWWSRAVARLGLWGGQWSFGVRPPRSTSEASRENFAKLNCFYFSVKNLHFQGNWTVNIIISIGWKTRSSFFTTHNILMSTFWLEALGGGSCPLGGARPTCPPLSLRPCDGDEYASSPSIWGAFSRGKNDWWFVRQDPVRWRVWEILIAQTFHNSDSRKIRIMRKGPSLRLVKRGVSFLHFKHPIA